MTEATSTAPLPTRALVLHPVVKSDAARSAAAEDRLQEAVGLAEAIDLAVVSADVVRLSRIAPAGYFGSGQTERIGQEVARLDAGLIVCDCALSPGQQRTLERAWKCKVIDRTALILEIFGARARTAEGRLQVELAHLSYQRSRLVRSWTHLERQRGGYGFLGGPGESQIEIDRRLIDDRIVKLKGELETVQKRRTLQRKARKAVPYPVVALVGYTNAGKSTLFNRVTGAEVLAKDMLFATLDPTMRAVDLPSGHKAILSDTVGFISDLPTQLVAAFRATLEEVRGADLIVHVRDIARTDSEAQAESVHAVLTEMGLDAAVDRGLFEVWNKIDLLSEEERERVLNQARGNAPRIAVSALTGEGLDHLLEAIDDHLGERRELVDVKISLSDGARIAWLYRNGEVVDRFDDAEFAHVRVSLTPENRGRYEALEA